MPQILELEPQAMVAGGEAMARDADGRVVFVGGALPGERVRAAVFGQSRDFRRARMVELLEASPYRTTPPCPEVARGCGSCQWQHVSPAGQRDLKRQVIEDALRRLARIPEPSVDPLIELPSAAYRTTVRAAVVDGRAGYRRARDHTVVAVDSCLVAHPLVEDLLVNGRYGGAQEVVLRCGARTGERLAVASPPTAAIDVPGDVRSDWLRERAAGRTWRISARSFFQSRADGADVLAGLVVDAAAAGPAANRSGRRVGIDLYAGVGLFAGVLAGKGWDMTMVESSRAACDDARVNVRGESVEIVRADVTKWSSPEADLVVVNPGRKGLAKRGVATVVGSHAPRVILVSCDVAAFGRDTHLLRQAGYSLTSVTPIDMFPHTFHVEIVSVFDR